VCIEFFALTVEFKDESEGTVVLNGALFAGEVEVVFDEVEVEAGARSRFHLRCAGECDARWRCGRLVHFGKESVELAERDGFIWCI
jgi:hypothetical protein